MGAWRLSLVVTHLSLCRTLLSCGCRASFLILLRSMRLVLSVLSGTTSLLSATNMSTPRLSALLLFFQWDESVDCVEPPPALNLHLVLSVSFHRSRVTPMLSVVGRRCFRAGPCVSHLLQNNCSHFQTLTYIYSFV
jgi:hypothetical protein